MISAKEEYEVLLRRLHVLIQEGNGESAEADDIRDRMDVPWYKMSGEDKRDMDRLSAELYKELAETS